jgi:hypothetical protein
MTRAQPRRSTRRTGQVQSTQSHPLDDDTVPLPHTASTAQTTARADPTVAIYPNRRQAISDPYLAEFMATEPSKRLAADLKVYDLLPCLARRPIAPPPAKPQS